MSKYTPKAKRVLLSAGMTQVRKLRREAELLKKWVDLLSSKVPGLEATDEQLDALRDALLAPPVKIIDDLEYDQTMDKGVERTLFECKGCDRCITGTCDGRFDRDPRGLWMRIANIDGPDALCPACVAEAAKSGLCVIVGDDYVNAVIVPGEHNFST